MRSFPGWAKQWSMVAVLAIWSSSRLPAAMAAGSLDKINHLILIYQDNWSFDSLYGKFPGANGLANALQSVQQNPGTSTVQQVDKNGKPYTTLPQPIDTTKSPPAPDPRFPANLPNAPFDLSLFVPPDQKTGD